MTVFAEWDTLKKVVMHKPGIELFLGHLELNSSLCERGFSLEKALLEYDNLINLLRNSFNVEIVFLKDAFFDKTKKSRKFKNTLINQIIKPFRNIKSEKDFDANSFYQRIEKMDVEDFFEYLNINLDISKSSQENHISFNNPMSNLFYMRDQQFVTNKGIVICNMAKSMRKKETKLTKFFFKEILEKEVFEIKSPGVIEGGEFFPMGDFCLIGIGDRSNQDAVNQLLNNYLEYKQVAVVHQPLHPLICSKKTDPMVNMHLDTYFNVASKNVVVGSKLLLKNAKVDIYHNVGNNKYELENKKTNLFDFVTKKGFEVIDLTVLEQLSYATNFLCVENGKIICVDVAKTAQNVLNNLEFKKRKDPKRYGKLFDQIVIDHKKLTNEKSYFPYKKELNDFGIEAFPICLQNLTGGYGAIHCMSGVLLRKRF